MRKEEFDTLVPSGGLSRRGFTRTALGAGFAAAALPVVGQTTIKTDSQGLVVGEVDIAVGDFRMPAYRAAPAGRTGAPVVLVISEIFGVHEHIADIARRVAREQTDAPWRYTVRDPATGDIFVGVTRRRPDTDLARRRIQVLNIVRNKVPKPIPDGDTVIETGDKLICYGDLLELRGMMEQERQRQKKQRPDTKKAKS